MNIWAVLPVRPADDGKSRLATVLTGAERIALNQKFYRHALKVTTAVFGVARTLVVSRSREVLESAASAGLRTLEEPSDGDLNRALAAANRVVRELGAGGVLSVSCDLPLLSEADLRAMLEALPEGETKAVIAPDAAGTGTNALLLAPPNLIAYAYGEGSFHKHTAALEAQGTQVVVVRREGLEFDVDTAPDLERLRRVDPGF